MRKAECRMRNVLISELLNAEGGMASAECFDCGFFIDTNFSRVGFFSAALKKAAPFHLLRRISRIGAI